MTAAIASRDDWMASLTGRLSDPPEDSPGLHLPPGFIEQYVKHLPNAELLDMKPDRVASLIRAHVALGAVRRPGETKVKVVVPDDDHPGRSTLILIVSDDRPFLVDTVSMNITRRGWSIRAVYHPSTTFAATPKGPSQARLRMTMRASPSRGSASRSFRPWAMRPRSRPSSWSAGSARGWTR